MKIKREDLIFSLINLDVRQMVEIESGLKERLKKIEGKEIFKSSSETINGILEQIEAIKRCEIKY